MNEREKYILDMADSKQVLHIGFADWPYTERRILEGELLHSKLQSVASRLIGVDVSFEAIDLIRRKMPECEVYHIDERGRYVGEHYDVLVVTEVIEHVEDQRQFLQDINEIESSSTRLILTTPNAYSFKGACRALLGREYQHPDHVLLHSTNTITQLLRNNDWVVKEIDYYLAPARTFRAKIGNLCVRGLAKLFSRRIFDGIMLVAEK